MRLRRELGRVGRGLPQQQLVGRLRVWAVHRHEHRDEPGALHVLQEPEAQPLSQVSALDDAGNIGGDERPVVTADIPGIIEGAHLGKGLGLRFLQHVERTRLIAVLVPVDSPDPQATYELLLREAASYSPELASKPHIVVLTKLDLLPAPRSLGPSGTPLGLPAIRTTGGAPVVAVSSVTREGLPELMET